MVKSQGPEGEDWKANCAKGRSALLMVSVSRKAEICEARIIYLEYRRLSIEKWQRDKLRIIPDNTIQK